MRKRFVLFFIITLIAFMSSDVISQMLPLKNYSTEDGLPQSTIRCIFQDTKGFIWFGTFNGVSKFNGTKFFNYSIEHGLYNNTVNAIHEDRNGNFWIGTDRGLNRIVDNKIMKTEVTEQIFRIIEDSNGNLFIVITPEDILRFDGKQYIPINSGKKSWESDIRDVFIDRKDNLWILTLKGLFKYKSTVEEIIIEEESLLERTECLLIDSEENIWIGTEKGLYKYTNGVRYFFSEENGLVDDHVLNIIEDTDHTIWIGTFKGLSRIEDEKITNFNRKNGLPDNIIVSLFEDRESVKWFGTNGGGVSKLSNEMFLNITEEIGLADELVMAIEQDKNGNYWFGSFNGGVTIYDGRDFSHITVSNGLPDNRVWCIKRDSRDFIWIGTEGGLVRYDGEKYQLIGETSRLGRNTVFSIDEDDEGNIWIGSGCGPFKYDGKNLIDYGEEIGYVDLIWSIYCDSKGEVWGGTNWEGVINLTRGENYFNRDNGLPSNLIRVIFEDHEGTLWFGTDGGLVKYDGKELITFTKEHGLSDNTCYSIIEDNNRNLWVGTNQGLNKINLDSEELVFINYNVDDGLIANELNSRSVLLDDKGTLWFGSIRGVIRCDPENEKAMSNPPSIYINEFKANNEIVPLNEKIKLNHTQNNISIDFYSLTFSSESSISFYHKLEGLSDDWNKTTDVKSAVYNYLPPGKYKLLVYAQNKYGIKSTDYAEVSFKIAPPFWQSYWFLGIIGFIAAVGIVTGRRVRRMVLIKKQVLEKKLHEAERIKDSEEKYRKLVEHSPNAVFITNIDMKIIDSNERIQKILGYSKTEFSQIKLETLFSKNFRRKSIKQVEKIISGKEVIIFETELNKKDAKKIPVEISVSMVEIGNFKYIQLIIQDISERKNIRDKLVQTEKLASIGTLVAGVAHELNNPLAVILGNSELLLRDSEIKTNHREKINRIKSNTERCANIVESLLGFARRKEPERKRIKINQLIDKTIEMREYQLGVNNILVKKNYQEEIPEIYGDSGQLQQVFLNLINNAFESMVEANRKGILQIKTYVKDKSICIEFIDNGPGVSKEIRSKIFDPFFTTKEIGRGTGLGLSVCYGIINEHKGEIHLDAYKRKGAKFIIKLPLNIEVEGKS